MPDLLSILRKSADYLGGKGIDSPRVEAELLVAHALDLDRIALYLQFDKPLTDESLGPIREVLKRRVRGEPVQYITGKAGFYEIELAVGSGVLIPRPETERLVDRALVLYEGGPVLDLCTGSGAVILSLWHARQEDGPFVAVDLSPEALVWAEKNRASLEADVELLEGDLFAPVAGRTFTLITTNPPYVTADEYSRLPTHIREWEPALALESGPDGMNLLTRIAAEGKAYLEPDGWLLSEIGSGQGSIAKSAFEAQGWRDVSVEQDYTGRDRVLVAKHGA